MTLECINPEDLPRPETYTQIVVAKGTRLVFVSGQEPEDVHGRLVGRCDLSIQARQVFGRINQLVNKCDNKRDCICRTQSQAAYC
jgi:enamine deaminase RidA (YjgF/YER057c/UK114 family)